MKANIIKSNNRYAVLKWHCFVFHYNKAIQHYCIHVGRNGFPLKHWPDLHSQTFTRNAFLVLLSCAHFWKMERVIQPIHRYSNLAVSSAILGAILQTAKITVSQSDCFRCGLAGWMLCYPYKYIPRDGENLMSMREREIWTHVHKPFLFIMV